MPQFRDMFKRYTNSLIDKAFVQNLKTKKKGFIWKLTGTGKIKHKYN